MNSENRTGQPHVRYLARVDVLPERTLHIRVESWMPKVLAAAGLPHELLCTYAALWTACRVGLSFSIQDLRLFAPIWGRSIQRQIRAMERAGLVVRCERLGEKAQLPNDYVMLFHPVMPPELKGPVYAPGMPQFNAAESARTTAKRNDVDVAEESDTDAMGGGDVGDACPMASASGDHNDQIPLHQHAVVATPVVERVVLPAPLREALEQAAPKHWRDSISVLGEELDKLPPERRRAVAVLALRKLIERIETGEVHNPPGLLRGRLLLAAGQDLDGLLTDLAHLRATIIDLDTRIAPARSRRELRETIARRGSKQREYVRLYAETFGLEPTEVPVRPVADPLVEETASALESLLDVHHAATGRGDDETARKIKERLDRWECGGPDVFDCSALLTAEADAFPAVDLEEGVRQSEAILERLRGQVTAPTEPTIRVDSGPRALPPPENEP